MPPPADCGSKAETAGCDAAVDAAEFDEESTFPEAASRLRCHDTSRRFGAELLYPISRYVSAFSEPTLRPEAGGGANPLFASASGEKEILVVSLVGTPWQDVVRDVNDSRGGIFRASQQPWGRFLGADAGEGELDPLNVESVAPRAGVHPVTGDALGAAGEGSNPINGFDRTFVPGDGFADDLQHACLVELTKLESCDAGAPSEACPCAQQPHSSDAGLTRPPDPICADRNEPAKPHAAKTFPATRFMRLSKALGEFSVLASSCPRNVDHDDLDYGFRPAFRSLLLGTNKSTP
jgi:hypothetical protein